VLKTFLDSSCFVVMGMVFKIGHVKFLSLETVIRRVLAFLVVWAGVMLDEIVLEAVSLVVIEIWLGWEIAFLRPLLMDLRNVVLWLVVRGLTIVFFRLILR